MVTNCTVLYYKGNLAFNIAVGSLKLGPDETENAVNKYEHLGLGRRER